MKIRYNPNSGCSIAFCTIFGLLCTIGGIIFMVILDGAQKLGGLFLLLIFGIPCLLPAIIKGVKYIQEQSSSSPTSPTTTRSSIKLSPAQSNRTTMPVAQAQPNHCFGAYSLNDFCKFSIRYFFVDMFEMEIPQDAEEMPEMREGILKILEIENITFEKFVKDYDSICRKYYNGGERIAISKQYGLTRVLDFFSAYLHDKRAQRISKDSFYKFLCNEAITQEEYNRNKPSSDDVAGRVNAVAEGKYPINYKISSSDCEKIIHVLGFVLDREDKTIAWLASHISTMYSVDFSDWIRKYNEFQNPSLQNALEWFWHYYNKEMHTI